MQESPLVSIVLPTYNRASLIQETIASVVSQTYSNWELIIVDDGSTDDTKERIAQRGDMRIRYFFIPHSGIIARVRNEGIKRSQGDYIAFLDSDDLWVPAKLEFQMSLFKKFCDVFFIFGHGEHFGDNATPTPKLEEFFQGNVFLPFLMEKRFIFYVPTLLFKKEALAQVHSIDETLVNAGDIDFFLRMAHDHEGIFSNQIVVKIRRQGISHSNENELKAYEEYGKMLDRLFTRSYITSRQFAALSGLHHYKLGLLHAGVGDRKKSSREFVNCIRLQPFNLKAWVRFLQSLVKMKF